VIGDPKEDTGCDGLRGGFGGKKKGLEMIGLVVRGLKRSAPKGVWGCLEERGPCRSD